MLKKTDRLIIQSYVGPLLATFFVCLFLLLMQFLWRYIDDLVGKGLEWGVIGELLFYATAQLVPMALPLAILLAAIMTFGNMGEHNELMAIKAAGVSLPRIMRPLIILNLVIGVSAFFFSNYMLPYTNLKMGALLYDIRQQRPELNIKEGIFYDGVPGINIKVSHKNYKTNTLNGIMIYDHRGHSGNMNITIADSGTIAMSENKQYLIFTVFDGITYEDVRDRELFNSARQTYPFRQQKFKRQQVYIELAGYDFSRTSAELFKNNYQMLNLKQLVYTQDSLKHHFVQKQRQALDRLLLSGFYLSYGRNKDDKNIYYNVDSAFKHLSNERKFQAYDFALSAARSSKMRIENSEKSLFDRREWISKHEIEWHKKFTLSFACILLFFVGGPFGAIVRKGGLGMPILISVLFFLFYYIITMIGEKNVKLGDMAPYYGTWLPSGIILIAGGFLMYRASTDTVIINATRYFRFITKYFVKERKLHHIYGKGIVTENDSSFYTSKLELFSESLGKYASDIEHNRLKNSMLCGSFLYPHQDKYLQLRTNYNSIFPEYIHTSDVEHMFILEQLLVMPKPHYIQSKSPKICMWILSTCLLGLPILIVGFIRLRILKNRIVKMRSHVLTILSFKEKRGLK